MDVVKKIFEDYDINNGSAVSWYPMGTKISSIYHITNGANVSGLIQNLKDRYKENNDT